MPRGILISPPASAMFMGRSPCLAGDTAPNMRAFRPIFPLLQLSGRNEGIPDPLKDDGAAGRTAVMVHTVICLWKKGF